MINDIGEEFTDVKNELSQYADHATISRTGKSLPKFIQRTTCAAKESVRIDEKERFSKIQQNIWDDIQQRKDY